MLRDQKFYEVLAGKLTDLTEHSRFQPTDVFLVDLSPEYGEVSVGPFIEVDMGWEQFWAFAVDQEKDQFWVCMSTDNWDSWGTHYGGFGNEFQVSKVITRKPVLEVIWDAKVPITRKMFLTW